MHATLRYTESMTDKPISITITAGTIVKAILITGAIALLYILRDLVLLILAAIVIASAVEPATLWFVRHKVPRVFGVLAVYLVALSIFFGLAYFFIPPLLSEASNLLASLPGYLQSTGFTEALNNNGLAKPLGDIASNLSVADTIAQARNALSSVSSNLFEMINVVFGGLFSFFLVLVLSFYLAAQERGIENFLKLITPLKHEQYVSGLWKRSQRKIGLWMQGQLILGLIVGVLVYLGLTVLGVEHAFFLAVISALFELIPLFGATLAAIPAVIVGFLDSVSVGFMVIGLYVVIQQFENHLIYPLVVRKVVGVPPILVILALVIGGKIAGFLGVILAVPIAAALMELTDDIEKGKRAMLEKAR